MARKNQGAPMREPPNVNWAIDLIRRWDKGERQYLTPGAVKIAREALKHAEDIATRSIALPQQPELIAPQEPQA